MGWAFSVQFAICFPPCFQMSQNMFQEGLYHVFFKDTPSTQTQSQAASHVELDNARIHRWFGTVVNSRLLVAGVRCYAYLVSYQLLNCAPASRAACVSPQVVQVISAVACILSTVTHACVSYNCSISMTTPVWSSLFVSPLSAGLADRNRNLQLSWLLITVCVSVCGCWLSGTGGSEESK